MSVLVECVPNFSEGSDAKTLTAIREAIESVAGVQVWMWIQVSLQIVLCLHLSGTQKLLKRAAKAIDVAGQCIDMSVHKGEHPRMGATDVCPFVPVQGVLLTSVRNSQNESQSEFGRNLGIPTYLYEAAASAPIAKDFPIYEKGEYEVLESKMGDAQWAPDFGGEWSESVAKTGATVIGARPFIAWNINLNTNNQRKAKIAATIRDKGAYVRGEDGELKRGEDGKPFRARDCFAI